jgi:hypothetical protein
VKRHLLHFRLGGKSLTSVNAPPVSSVESSLPIVLLFAEDVPLRYLFQRTRVIPHTLLSVVDVQALVVFRAYWT